MFLGHSLNMLANHRAIFLCIQLCQFHAFNPSSRMRSLLKLHRNDSFPCCFPLQDLVLCYFASLSSMNTQQIHRVALMLLQLIEQRVGTSNNTGLGVNISFTIAIAAATQRAGK
jgi:hypothetical protein